MTVPAKLLCLALVIDRQGGRILLGHKLRGIGMGKIVGLGGHLEPGETARAAAARELEEESGLVVPEAALVEVARVWFDFASPDWPPFDVAVFTADTWTGEIRDCDEIEPAWYRLDALPWERMWDDNRIWLPHVLRGEAVDTRIGYDLSGERVVSVQLTVR
ncbi:NUDIX domain-containing protein [Calidifontibacter sp. DB0510]|uniref:Oxidized purine nucleoside triphosphate hydrolase n=1 Tax=Metallococcus carri TaxID=1656884 RepID=A0A967B2L7_9MICO|nr:NUDIX domain-containing protein [Metallococcus carri]NHN57158.1 NUDIX domain-containing protein [Metallococcus carri]NOP38039.1 NUDIX domain-containing protein [Calidifontibacter sp. DB2511S]